MFFSEYIRRLFVLPVCLFYIAGCSEPLQPSEAPKTAVFDSSGFSRVLQERFMEGKGDLNINGETLLGAPYIEQMYQLTRYKPLWNDATAASLLQEINQAVELDGLQKKDYWLPGLKRLDGDQRLSAQSVENRVELELALTESFLRLAYHLRFGKVDPVTLDTNWNYSKRLDMNDPVPTLVQALNNQNIDQLMNQERPSHPYYYRLRPMLPRYLSMQSTGGWGNIPKGSTIKSGQSDHRIPVIRKRLQISGDLDLNDTPQADLDLYDVNLQQGVKRFQFRHGLESDGKIGKQTIAEMNVPVADRINQIRVNLERLRWIMQDIDNDFLLVDIPGFKVYLIHDGEKIWEDKIQVGRAYTETPVFRGDLKYLEFNPTWTIPPGIIKKTVLPNLKKDSGYLDRKGYQLLDFKGRKLDPNKIDWKKVKSFPYVVRQPAGKKNALGQVKFIFPNSHFVFLHDTNHRELFSRTARSFSAGCIRVSKPFDLAELLLKDNKGWNRDTIDSLLASGKTERVFPKQHIPVLITYTTVGVGDNGEAIFKPDIYHRDVNVLQALNGPITVAPEVQEALKKFAEQRLENSIQQQ